MPRTLRGAEEVRGGGSGSWTVLWTSGDGGTVCIMALGRNASI